jgi:hypothetical protein
MTIFLSFRPKGEISKRSFGFAQDDRKGVQDDRKGVQDDRKGSPG